MNPNRHERWWSCGFEHKPWSVSGFAVHSRWEYRVHTDGGAQDRPTFTPCIRTDQSSQDLTTTTVCSAYVSCPCLHLHMAVAKAFCGEHGAGGAMGDSDQGGAVQEQSTHTNTSAGGAALTYMNLILSSIVLSALCGCGGSVG